MKTKHLKCINIVVQLPDKRILLHKSVNGVQWEISIEHHILPTESSLGCVNNILWNLFGIDPFNYSDDYVEIKRYPQTDDLQDENIVIYIMKLKSSIAFKSEISRQFKAVRWSTLLMEIMSNSIHIRCDATPEHTPNSIIVARELHIKEVFNK